MDDHWVRIYRFTFGSNSVWLFRNRKHNTFACSIRTPYTDVPLQLQDQEYMVDAVMAAIIRLSSEKK